MDVGEFLATQDHPLIRAVLARVYGEVGTAGDRSDQEGPPRDASLTPLVEMLEAGVQWPGREPYATYFGAPGSS